MAEKRPPRYLASPTKDYQTFDEWYSTCFAYTYEVLASSKEEAIALLKEKYDQGLDLDNEWDDETVGALDNISMIKVIEGLIGHEIVYEDGEMNSKELPKAALLKRQTLKEA